MNGHWSTKALIGCLVLSLAACSQIGTPTPKVEASSPVITLPEYHTPTEPAPVSPTQVLTNVMEPTETQQAKIVPLSTTQVINKSETVSGIQEQPPVGDEATESVDLARQDLAQRLGIPVDGITVTAVVGQEFSKETFNCQTSKERIAKEESPQVISGLSILLSVSGDRYEYHASGQTVSFCRSLP